MDFSFLFIVAIRVAFLLVIVTYRKRILCLPAGNSSSESNFLENRSFRTFFPPFCLHSFFWSWFVRFLLVTSGFLGLSALLLESASAQRAKESSRVRLANHAALASASSV